MRGTILDRRSWKQLTDAVCWVIRRPRLFVMLILVFVLLLGTNAYLFESSGFKDYATKVQKAERTDRGALLTVVDWGSHSRHTMAMMARSRLAVGNKREVEPVLVARISAELLSVLGVEPVVGREFTPQDDRVAAEKVALISSAYWEARFASDLEVVGSKVTLDDAEYTVIGVLPSKLDEPSVGYFRDVDFWVPIGLFLSEIKSGSLTTSRPLL